MSHKSMHQARLRTLSTTDSKFWLKKARRVLITTISSGVNRTQALSKRISGSDADLTEDSFSSFHFPHGSELQVKRSVVPHPSPPQVAPSFPADDERLCP